MNKLDYDYFDWLVAQIHTPANNRTYNELFSRMHNTEFVWTVPNDDNRLRDGLALRSEFLNGSRRRLDVVGVSILEVLIALSRRVAFTAGGDAEHWAWRLIKNLRLNKAYDPLTDEKALKVDDTLYALIWRTYASNGRGGLFPLKRPNYDQTKQEIWDQMNAYIIEAIED
jgi:hypothetical protein